MQHFSTLGNAAYKFFKTSVLIPRGQSVSAVTGGGGVNIFAKIDSTLRVTTANPRNACICF